MSALGPVPVPVQSIWLLPLFLIRGLQRGVRRTDAARHATSMEPWAVLVNIWRQAIFSFMFKCLMLVGIGQNDTRNRPAH